MFRKLNLFSAANALFLGAASTAVQAVRLTSSKKKFDPHNMETGQIVIFGVDANGRMKAWEQGKEPPLAPAAPVALVNRAERRSPADSPRAGRSSANRSRSPSGSPKRALVNHAGQEKVQVTSSGIRVHSPIAGGLQNLASSSTGGLVNRANSPRRLTNHAENQIASPRSSMNIGMCR